MLVLTRCVDDSIQIGDHVEITVLEIKGAYVKLGVNAPRDLVIHRSEVYIKIHRPSSQSKRSRH